MGDQRPINREIDHPAIGKLLYSDDDEAWFSDPTHNDAGIRFLIDGDWDSDAESISPATGLTTWAEEIVRDLGAFLAELQAFLESEKAGRNKDYSDDIDALEVDFFMLGPEKRPGEGTIYFKENTADRCWRCDYLDKKPRLLGFDR